MTHEFGGAWTDKKLEVVRRYFNAYATALKRRSFRKLYIDTFAGSGERTDTSSATTDDRVSLFGDAAPEFGEIKEGSARIALGIDPPFDRYVFIDIADEHIAKLEALRSANPHLTIDIVQEDANAALAGIAKTTNWTQIRAAVFIDPYGMQVDWTTLQALAATKAVDIAILFPTGALNRLIRRDGDIPPEWRARIDRHLGPCDWEKDFYSAGVQTDLFTESPSGKRKIVTADGLRLFVLKRLRSIFPHVCEMQLELTNSAGAVMFHLFIACANPSERAGALAMRIARGAVRRVKQGGG